MTNMRGFCGPSGGLALQPGVTDTADLYHTSGWIRAEQGGHTCSLDAQNSESNWRGHMSEKCFDTCKNYKPRMTKPHMMQAEGIHDVCARARVSFLNDVKGAVGRPAAEQNCYFCSSKSRFKDQHLAGLNGKRGGLHVYQVANFKDTQWVMRAEQQTIAPHCHSATITTARGLKAHFFPPLIIGLFFPPPSLSKRF